MQPLSIIALLCEDIRDEVGGSFSIIGAMPDNATVSAMSEKPDVQQKFLGKLSVLIRANFDPEDRLPTIKFRIVMPDDAVIDAGEASAEVIATAQSQARERGNPIAGTISRAILFNFQPPKPGILRVEAIVRDETRIVGIINFMPSVSEVAISSTAH